MKNKNRIIIGLIVLILLGLGIFSQIGYARDYRFTDLLIDIKMNSDGSLDVHEKRSVVFDGKYTGMFQWIDLRGNIRIRDVVIAEDGVEYTESSVTKPGPPHTYYVKQERDRLYIDWSFHAESEQRTFDIMYSVDNAVLVHDDFAELYHKFIGSEWDKGVDYVQINLYLPGPTNLEDLRAWGHGPLHGLVSIIDEQHIRWEISPLAARTMLEGRVLFAKDVVSQADKFTGRSILSEILAEEQKYADDANLKRQEAAEPSRLNEYSLREMDKQVFKRKAFGMNLPAALIIIVLIIAITIGFYLRYGVEYRPEFEGEYYRELPGHYTPAELGVLWNRGQVESRDFTATLMDLARRRYLSIEERTSEKQGLFRTRTKTEYYIISSEYGKDKLATLKNHEQLLLDFLFLDVGDNQKLDGQLEISFEDIERYARRKSTAFAKFWKEWKAEVEAAAEEHQFFDKSGKYAETIMALVGFLFIFFAFVAGVASLASTGIIVACIISGIIMIIAAATIRRRSQSGSTDYAKWKAFKRFLEHFSEISRQDIPALVVWEHYLVYAITLGVAKKVINQLQIVYPNLEDGHHRFGHGWYYYTGTVQAAGLHTRFNNLTSSIEKSVNTTVSSGAGRGGGFSGGGGGGSGGGGGGAR